MSEDTLEKVEKFAKRFHNHGLRCGQEIAIILAKWHPDFQIYPLYRSAIAMKNVEDHIEIFAAGDPHVWGLDLTEENMHDQHIVIVGDRYGPKIYLEFGGEWIELTTDKEDLYQFEERIRKGRERVEKET